MAKELSVRVKRELSLEQAKERIFKKAGVIVAGALRAPEAEGIDLSKLKYDDAGRPVPPHGWTLIELKAALHALNAKKNAPVYIEIAQRNLELEAKIAALRAPPQALNIGSINIVQPPKYDVIDVTPVTKE